MGVRYKLSVVVAVVAISLAVVVPVSLALDSRIKGKLPELEDVFTKLFANTVRMFSFEQIQKEFNQLGEEDRAAMANFLGKDRWARVVEGLEDQKKKFLEASYAKYAGKSDPAAFKKALPRILAINANLMTPDQVKQSLAVLNDKEMGTLTISMGYDGLKVLFTAVTKDRHLPIIVSTPDWVLLEMGLIKYDSIRDYTCTLLKQEKIGGKLQGVETIEMKFRVKPAAIFAKWVNGPFTDREALYNFATGPNKLRVREGGALGIIPVTVPIDSPIAKRGTNHLLTEIGLQYLLNMILTDYNKAFPAGDLTRRDVGMATVDGKSVFVMDSILKKSATNKYYCHRIRHYINYVDSLEIKAEVFDWNDQMYESYTYTKLVINPGLKDVDFLQTNPSYRLK